MEDNPNVRTYNLIQQEIKHLKAKCREACDAIENSRTPTVDNGNENILRYIDGCRIELENIELNTISDENCSTSLFTVEHQDRISQLNQIIAYKRGVICDIEKENIRLKSLIKSTKDAKTIKNPEKSEVNAEHIHLAKEHFLLMKNHISNLINALHPEHADEIIDLLAQLMVEKLNENSSGYIEVTDETFHVIEIVKDMELVTTHPYDIKLIKLSF